MSIFDYITLFFVGPRIFPQTAGIFRRFSHTYIVNLTRRHLKVVTNEKGEAVGEVLTIIC